MRANCVVWEVCDVGVDYDCISGDTLYRTL